MGVPKGALPGRDGVTPIISQLLDDASAAGCENQVAVGDHDAYDALLQRQGRRVPRTPDAPSGVGPLGGIGGLLRWVEQDARPISRVVIASCDLPFVTEDALRMIARPLPAESHARVFDAPSFAPFPAILDIAHARRALDETLAAGERSLRAFFARLEVIRVQPDSPRWIRDWDTPDDVARDRASRAQSEPPADAAESDA